MSTIEPKASRRGRNMIGLAEAAAYLNVTVRTVRNYISRGTIPAYRVSGSSLILLDKDEIERELRAIPATRSRPRSAATQFGPKARISTIPPRAEVYNPEVEASK